GIAPASAPVRTESSHLCTASIGVPLQVTLAVDPASIVVGGTVMVQGHLESNAQLASIDVEKSATGAARVLDGGKRPLDGSLNSEGQLDFTVPVVLEGTEPSEVTVAIEARDAASGQVYTKNETIAFYNHNGRWYADMGIVLQLRIRAIEDDYNAGRLSEDEARAATRELARVDAEVSDAPVVRPLRTAEEQSLVDRLALAPADVPVSKSPGSVQGTCITIEGHIGWRDENNNLHDAFGLSVQIWDEDTVIDEFVDVTATDTNGNYHIEVNGDDGFLQGDRDIYVRIISANTAVSIETAGLFGSVYENVSGVSDETPCGTTITRSVNFVNTDPTPAMQLCESGTWVASYVADQLNGDSFLGQIVLEWPGTTTSANYDGSDINLRPGDRWDWDVLHHEYGHYVQDVFNTEDNPGGPHNIGDCVSDVHNSKSEGIRLAWGEGWPTYNGTNAQLFYNLASRSIPRVGDANYADSGESNFNYNLDDQDSNGMGEDNEVAVQRILWDWNDGASDSRDAVNLSEVDLFNWINAADPTSFSAAWAAIRPNLSAANLLAAAEVLSDHFVGPRLTAPAENAIVSPSNNNNLSWTRGAGCSSVYDGDGFTVRFFRADNSAPILSIPVGNTTSHALTLGELQTLVAATHNVLWGVEASNSSSPGTGPYLGETFAITVNRPPDADAGDDVTAECSSQTTTPVQLDGTGSSDPDGDALTYTWSAPGVTWDNNHSATPTGNFPFGTKVVTLEVSDGIETDTDQVNVTIEDTTPPEITCPVAVTIECNDHCEGGGVPKDDAQLTDFFTGVSATDICDTDITFANDAPDCFPVGTTDVVFTATDGSNNAASCTTSVTVEDTTPPEITVVLSRDALWPPNHKMADISAEVTVTDICDPNPTFVLTSVTSDEPDNGLGDGDTPNDIQGVTYGEADTEFQLRSERAGNRDGRKYTIIYTASDISGNTTLDTTCVFVPHDQRGHANTMAGFLPVGQALDPSVIEFRLVIPSRANFNALTVPGATAIVGNSIDAMRPLRFEYRDVNGDHEVDLSLWYDTKSVIALRDNSNRLDPVGLHYWGSDGQGYLLNSIVKLEPMIEVVAAAGSENSDRPEDGSEVEGEAPPIGTDGGVLVTGFDPHGALVLAEPGPVTVDLFDVTGRKVKTLITGDLSAGTHELSWDGRDDAGRAVASGLYFYRVITPEGVFSRKLFVSR
ncbi:MAG TPA: FlgD immunoglobulin-like domain containing protein, partial [Candidatus Eisenbacteria bacterium]